MATDPIAVHHRVEKLSRGTFHPWLEVVGRDSPLLEAFQGIMLRFASDQAFNARFLMEERGTHVCGRWGGEVCHSQD